jgi:hypothetical protein
MVFFSSGTSVSSSYSNGNNHLPFKSSPLQQQHHHDSLATALDNKYLKRKLEMQRRHQLEMSRCSRHMVTQLKLRYRHAMVLVILIASFSLCSFWFFCGWMSAYYGGGVDDTQSLQDLAESIRRMRLRRHQALHGNDRDPAADLLKHHDGDNHHYHSNAHNLKTINNNNALDDNDDITFRGEEKLLIELKVDNTDAEEENRLKRLEEKIRQEQNKEIKEELKFKRLENKMDQTIQALKHYKEHSPPKVPDIIEEEKFT